MSLTPEDAGRLLEAVENYACTHPVGTALNRGHCTLCAKIAAGIEPTVAALLGQHVEAAKREALYDARDALYRGEGPDQYEGSDILYGEWLGNRADRGGGES